MIVLDGIRRMYYEEEDIWYYITLMNENYEMPILPLGSTEGIAKGIYRLSCRDLGPERPKVQLFGSGAILREALRAQEILEQQLRRGQQRLQRDQLQGALLRRPRLRALEPAAPRPGAPPALRDRRCWTASRARSWPPPTTSPPSRRRSPPGCPSPTRCWAPTASAAARPAANCGGSSRSTPRTSPWPPSTSWPARASYPREKLADGHPDPGLDPRQAEQVQV